METFYYQKNITWQLTYNFQTLLSTRALVLSMAYLIQAWTTWQIEGLMWGPVKPLFCSYDFVYANERLGLHRLLKNPSLSLAYTNHSCRKVVWQAPTYDLQFARLSRPVLSFLGWTASPSDPHDIFSFGPQKNMQLTDIWHWATYTLSFHALLLFKNLSVEMKLLQVYLR